MIYLIIVNYRNWQDTIECLQSVMQSDYPDFHIFIIDNASPNDSYAQIAAFLAQEAGLFHKSTLIQAPNNNGFAAGNNIALRKILHEEAFIYLLNPDTTIAPDTLSQLLACYQAQPEALILGTNIHQYDAPEEVLCLGGGKINPHTGMARLVRDISETTHLNYIHGASLFSHNVVFRKVGLLPEEYFLYWEETDWCHQAKNLGFRLALCAEAICYDKVGGSVGRGSLSEYYYTLNCLRFHQKYFPERLKKVFLYNCLRLLKKLFLGKFTQGQGLLKALHHFITN